jgi:hypothetical protein
MGMLQIGITNNAKERTDRHSSRRWQVLEIPSPMDGLLARGWEKSILEHHKSNGAFIESKSGLPQFDGFTEAWIEKSLPVKTLKDLMGLLTTRPHTPESATGCEKDFNTKRTDFCENLVHGLVGKPGSTSEPSSGCIRGSLEIDFNEGDNRPIASLPGRVRTSGCLRW